MRFTSCRITSAALAVTVFALAGCGGSGRHALVSVGFNAKLKQNILVDSKGMTLYLWGQESDGKPNCYDDATYHCSRAWVPLRSTTKPTAGKGVNQSLLSTVRRNDGDPQVTYEGHPLYTDHGSQAAALKGDRKPGDVNGQGYYYWYVVSPSGRPITKSAS